MKMDQRKHGEEKRKKLKRIYERTEIIRGRHENGSTKAWKRKEKEMETDLGKDGDYKRWT